MRIPIDIARLVSPPNTLPPRVPMLIILAMPINPMISKLIQLIALSPCLSDGSGIIPRKNIEAAMAAITEDKPINKSFVFSRSFIPNNFPAKRIIPAAIEANSIISPRDIIPRLRFSRFIFPKRYIVPAATAMIRAKEPKNLSHRFVSLASRRSVSAFIALMLTMVDAIPTTSLNMFRALLKSSNPPIIGTSVATRLSIPENKPITPFTTFETESESHPPTLFKTEEAPSHSVLSFPPIQFRIFSNIGATTSNTFPSVPVAKSFMIRTIFFSVPIGSSKLITENT